MFDPQQQVGDPPDFLHVGILHSTHEQGHGVAGQDFRAHS